MPINSNVGASERVSVDRGGAADVEIGFSGVSGQNVSIDRSGTGQQAEVDYGDGGGYGYDEADYQDYANQMAARDMGSMASQQQQPQQQMQQRQVQQQQQQQQQQQKQQQQQQMQENRRQGHRPAHMAAPTRATDTSPLVQERQEQFRPAQSTPADQANGQRIPVLDPSEIGTLGVMSSRYTPTIDDNFEENVTRVTAAMRPSDTTKETPKPREGGHTTGRQQASEDATSGQIRQDVVDNDKPSSMFNRPVGYSPKSREVRAKQPSMQRNAAAAKAEKKSAAERFKSAGVGHRIYGKINGKSSDDLTLRDIGVGVQEIMAVVEQNPTMLNKLLQRYTNIDVDVTGWNASEVTKFINSHDIYVATFKPPNNDGPDTQRRRLRVISREQRGIYLHHIMATMYNADFDGDDAAISLSPFVSKKARDPMSYMINIDGKQKLDISFFPIRRLVGGYFPGKTAKQFVREVMLANFSQLGSNEFIDRFVDAVIELGETELKGDSEKKAALANVFNMARVVADAAHPRNVVAGNTLMSDLCQAVYDGMRDIGRWSSYMVGDVEVLEYGSEGIPSPLEYDDLAIHKVVDGMVRGEVPNNSVALKVMLSGFIGDVRGKNASFRFTANQGKLMKIDDRLKIGDGSYEVDPNNKEQMEWLFESTVAYAEAQRMANEIKKNGRSQYYTNVLREKVIGEVGFPERYDRYGDFLEAFCNSYAKHSALINEANLVHLTGGAISSHSNKGLVSPLNPSANGVTYSDLAEPMLSVYGNSYSVGRLFKNLVSTGVMGDKVVDPKWKGNPNHVTKLRKHGQDVSSPFEREYEYSASEFWVNGKYINYGLRRFRNENHLIRSHKSVTRLISRKITDATSMTDSEAELHMLLAIADKRTGAASSFTTNVYGAMESEHVAGEKTTVGMMSSALLEMERLDTNGTVSGRRDQQRWIDSAIDTLIYSGPDMFRHFNMDSPAGFLKSPWAKKMMEHANNPEILGGIRTAMVFDTRMERITSLTEKLTSNKESMIDTYQNLKFAIDELGAASEVWHGILREFEAEASPHEESVFHLLTNRRTPKQKSISGEVYGWKGQYTYDAVSFWLNPGEHTSLRSVIEDLDMDRNTKWNVIADVVRYWEQDVYLKSWEVGYQLEIGNDSSYSLNSGGSQGALSVHRDFEQAFTRWGKTSQQKMQKNIDDAAKYHKSKPGHLMRTLRYLDASPWEMVEITDGMYANAVLSPKNKVYAQTEKGSQHPWTNELYTGLSLQVIGGYMHDITRTDDRVLGIQSTNAISIHDVIHILADPTAELFTYNKFGEYTFVNRDVLLQNALNRELSSDVEADIWEFLEMEPRIAAAIRKHNACAISDTDGTGYLGATLSTNETMNRAVSTRFNPVNHVKYLMRDKPSYAALISLISPGVTSHEYDGEISGFRGDNFFLSNFYESDVTVDGITYRNAEAAFQAQKCANPNDRLKFVSLDGKSARRLGRTVTLIDNWDSVRVDAMRKVISAKFADPELRTKLRNTGNKRLVEANNWGDRFWGAVNGDGRNTLGQILMDERGDETTTTDSAARNERGRIIEIENYLAHLIYDRASSSMSSSEAAMDILNDLGVTRVSIFNANRSDYDVYMSKRNLKKYAENMQQAESDDIYDNVYKSLVSHIDEVRSEVKLGMDTSTPSKPSFIGIDKVSLASYWDVTQELSGAKTAVSTGIEGSETYSFAEWASHITMKDNFTDLESAVVSLADRANVASISDQQMSNVSPDWNGAWTNLTNEDGSPVFLVVDENGLSIPIVEKDGTKVYTSIREARESQGLDELVVRAPDSYTVQDRSTDYHGNPVASPFIYLVSKRANGAEANNLKVKKSGIDGKDSILKMKSKYRMVKDESGNVAPVNFRDLRDKLRKTAAQYGDNGLLMAKLELAKELLSANEEFDYDDLTLSNYMCIADLMLIEGDDSQIYLRSLEMLFSAIKHRIGFDIDNMTDAELRNAADAIVRDASESGVGISMMNPADAFDEITPKSKSNATESINPWASSFERNYDLLSEIEKFSEPLGVRPISQALAEKLNTKLTDKKRGVNGVKDVANRISTIRNHNVVGYAAASDGSESIRWTVGPSNTIVIGEGRITQSRVAEICYKAYEHGMTVVVSASNRDKIPSEMIPDSMPCSDYDDVLIPCFDMRLNGSEAAPYNGSRFAIYQIPFSRYTSTVEDPDNFFELGDAQYQVTKYLTDRIQNVDGNTAVITADSLFPNVFGNSDYENYSLTVSFASGDEISRLIADGVKCTIDYGVVEGGDGFKQRKHDVDMAIKRYQDRWSEANADGMMMTSECRPGDIVAWAEVLIEDQFNMRPPEAVLAPIIPFPLHGAMKNVPEKFMVESVTNDTDTTMFEVGWKNVSSIENGFGKYFDSSGPANKGIISFTDAIDTDKTPLLLKSGIPVDTYCYKESIGGRNVGTDYRIKTMKTLMTQARIIGYNFARVVGSFPNNPDVKERLLTHSTQNDGLSSADWRSLLRDGDFNFIDDPYVNSFINFEVRKILRDGGNPTHYLASVYEDENGIEHNPHVMWEFEAMFEQSYNYEDDLLAFLHMMNPSLCPSSIEDYDDKYVFRVSRDSDGYKAGVLEMQAPFPLNDQYVSYKWANVYTAPSFFGEDQSAFSRPNVDGASNFLDAMNTMSYLGVRLNETDARNRALWASSDIGRIHRDGGAIGKA